MRTDLKIPQEVKPLAKESKASDAPQEQPKKKKKKHSQVIKGFTRVNYPRLKSQACQ